MWAVSGVLGQDDSGYRVSRAWSFNAETHRNRRLNIDENEEREPGWLDDDDCSLRQALIGSTISIAAMFALAMLMD